MIDVVADQSALEIMVKNTNTYMREMGNEYIGRESVTLGSLREDVYDRQKTDDILIYTGDGGKYSQYLAVKLPGYKPEKNCISFVNGVLDRTEFNTDLGILYLYLYKPVLDHIAQ